MMRMRHVSIFTLVTAILLCLFVLPNQAEAATVASGTCGDNLTWTLDDAGTLTITGTGAMDDYLISTAPWYNDRASITKVTLSEGVTSIGKAAFCYCSSLTDIDIPDSINTIGESAFEDCNTLCFVSIPENVTSIGDYAFKGCGFTSITIPNSVTYIGTSAFRSCELMNAVTLGNGITEIGEGAFYNCASLISITIPDGVSRIEHATFQGCIKLTKISIPGSVNSFGYNAFCGCTSLATVTIPYGVESIDAGAFAGCKSLDSIIIPNSVSWVGGETFSGCSNLTKVTISESMTRIAGGMFGGCTSLTSVTIPDGVTQIAYYAFSGCTGLSNITIPGSVTDIGEDAFHNCTSLIDVYYGGVPEQWSNVSIGLHNEDLTKANVIYINNNGAVVVTQDDELIYSALVSAINDAVDSYVRLTGNTKEDITITQDVYIDLNGFLLIGDISIADGATLYVFDSATADYTADNRGRIVGTITGDLAKTLNTPKSAYGHNYKYLTLKESDGSYSFHRYYLTVKSAVLKPYIKGSGYTGTAVDYKTVFKCNDVMAQYVTAYGTKLVGDNTVYADYMANGYSLLTGADNINEQSTWLSGTFKTTNSAEVNAANALRKPTASAYITLADGTEITSAGVQRSLQDMIVYANGLTDLTAAEKAALGKMYDLFKDVLDTWTEVDISAIKQYGTSLV